MNIEIAKLEVSPFNVRRNVRDISELVESDRTQGILEPIVARRAGDKYEVIIGARRLVAAKEAGLTVVPAEVREMTDVQALAQSLVENLHRGDLQLEERVEAYKKLQALDYTTYGSTKALAKVIGKNQSNIVRDFDAYEALIRLRPKGVEVMRYASPTSEERRRGEVLPEYHAAMLKQAISGVGSELPPEVLEAKYVELARTIAPLEQEEARRVLDEFKKYPERPVSESRDRALSTVGLELTLDRLTARRLDELAETSGKKSPAEVITYLVERAEGLETPAPKERKLVDEIEVGAVECPLCQKHLRLLHRKPAGSKPSVKDSHGLEEIVE